MTRKRGYAVFEPPIIGVLVMQSWLGTVRTGISVVGQTPRRWRIRAIVRTKIGGRNRWLEPGDVALVPLGAVRIPE